ncbi:MULTISPECIES: FadR/GntR family transcriptional regulator [unclassified Sphingomonas]|uniref:FadR/GntR family transcriptional regulator n=1 Tax=unclassified Sphingomonas TaxID=196159 RepID=UPI0006FE5A29|nr:MULTISPECIES: FadR/GntR family transcriptional regulator [unclassified Sphingomonas]KQM62661.1 hypothetical protein ASE65_17960 [Sphingomonas sp. Leaf16]KQN14912.1 hypothetical protein ASE81_17975 [Sphingomonas sp. Leaf29]KQN20444.1 hypothetical protein ASE83_17940 [Sphingomonas sp. Leaf32]
MAQPEKLYRRVIDFAVAQMNAGTFPIGARLPTERDLAESLAVSRATVREAMVALEIMGVVEIRKGSGIYVVAPSALKGRGATLDIGAFELLEARRSIEAEVAALAAQRITAEELAELAALLEVMTQEDVAAIERADRDFHLCIAKATGNAAMVSVVTDLWNMRDRCPLARTIHLRARGGDELLRLTEHRTVFDALRARDPDHARQAMRDHLDAVIDHLLAKTESDELAAVRQRSSELRGRMLAKLA